MVMIRQVYSMSVKVAQMLRPFNKGFSALQIKLVMNDLVFRYTRNIKDQMQIKVFKEKEDYFIYAKVPSESNDEYPDSKPIHYDVVIQLSPPNKASLAWTDIREYDAKVYANIPSFVFTFNYVYHFRRALITMPNGFYTRQAVMERPRVRNPLNLLGIEKSLWFTIFYLDDHKIFKRSNIDGLLIKGHNLVKLIKEESIKSQDRKLAECEVREKHKRDLKEVEKKRKGRAAARAKAIHNPARNNEIPLLMADMASGLKKESIDARSINASQKTSLDTSSLRAAPRTQSHMKGGLQSNLKGSLRR
jgi:hypothetical protein